MVKSKDELMTSVKSIIGDRSDDDAIQFLEDFSDTVESFSDAEEWRKRYEENDRCWRERYRARFFDGGPVEPPPTPGNEPPPTPGKVVEHHDEGLEYTYEQLFEKKEM